MIVDRRQLAETGNLRLAHVDDDDLESAQSMVKGQVVNTTRGSSNLGFFMLS